MLLNENNDLNIIEKAEQVLDALRPGFAATGGDINVVDYSRGILRVRFSGSYIGYASDIKGVEDMISREIKIALPEVETVDFIKNSNCLEL